MSDLENTEQENTEEQDQTQNEEQGTVETTACPDCVNKHGVSTGLQDFEHLCPTCEGSGSVAVV